MSHLPNITPKLAIMQTMVPSDVLPTLYGGLAAVSVFSGQLILGGFLVGLSIGCCMLRQSPAIKFDHFEQKLVSERVPMEPHVPAMTLTLPREKATPQSGTLAPPVVSATIRKPPWSPDRNHQRCSGECGRIFGAVLRKHHCRGCGLVFCEACTPQRVHMPLSFGYGGPQRCCLPCSRTIALHRDQQPSAASPRSSGGAFRAAASASDGEGASTPGDEAPAATATNRDDDFFAYERSNPTRARRLAACTDKLAAWAAAAAAAPGGLPGEGLAFLTRPTLRRYAAAREGDFEAARGNILRTLAWRVKNVPPHLCCPTCRDRDPHSHCFFPIGVDAQRRVVVYASAAKARTNQKDEAVQHMSHTLERAWRSTSALGLHHQWVWVIDFAGFSWRDAMQSETSGHTLTTFGDHMPERMGLILLLNPPRVFDVLLAAIRPFVNAVTLAKLRVLRCTADTAAAQLEPFLGGGGGGGGDGGNGSGRGQGEGSEGGDGGRMGRFIAACLALPPTPGSLPPLEGLDVELLARLGLPGGEGFHGQRLPGAAAAGELDNGVAAS